MSEIKSKPVKRTPVYFIKRFAERTSVVGPTYISTSGHIASKLFWLILFLSAISMTVVMVTNNFIRFYSYPIKTTVSIGYTQLTFPMITVCNSNAVRLSQISQGGPQMKSFMNAIKPSKYERKVLNQSSSETTTMGETSYTSTTEGTPANESLPSQPSRPLKRRKRFVLKSQQQSAFNISFLPDDYDEFENDAIGGEDSPQYEVDKTFNYLMSTIDRNVSQSMGHQLSDMLLSCSFEGKTCSADNFSLIQINGYGNCYKFNAGHTGSTYTSHRTGTSYGLQLIMYMETDEYINGLTLGYGLKLSISPPKTFPPLESEGMFVDAGAETNIGIQLVNISRLPLPYANCSDETGDAFLTALGLVYTRLACQETCSALTVYNTCGCYEQGIEERYPKTIVDSTRRCDSTDRQCVNKIKENILNNVLECNCPTACNESVYQTTVTNRQWPEEEYMNSLIDAVCSDTTRESDCNRLFEMSETQQMRNFLKLNVFYRDLNYQTISQEADYPTSSFFSDLGGSIGLWVGFSVLGIVELLQLALEICYSTCRSFARKTEISASTDKKDGDEFDPYSLQTKGINPTRFTAEHA